MDFIKNQLFKRITSNASKSVLGLALLGWLLLAMQAMPLQAQEPSAWEKIQASGKLKVALYLQNAPYSDGDSNQIQGVDVAVAQAIAEGLGLQAQFLPFQADERMSDDLRNMVWKGHYLGYGPADVMLHVPVDPYFIRENPQVLITEPYTRESLVLFYNPDKVQEASPDALQGKRIAAETGIGSTATLMTFANGRLREDVVLYPSGIAAVQAVLQGKADAAYVTQAQAQAALFADQTADLNDWGMQAFSLPSMPARGWALGAAVKKSNRPLAEAIEAQIKALRNSGELQKIFAQYGLTLGRP